MPLPPRKVAALLWKTSTRHCRQGYRGAICSRGTFDRRAVREHVLLFAPQRGYGSCVGRFFARRYELTPSKESHRIRLPTRTDALHFVSVITLRYPSCAAETYGREFALSRGRFASGLCPVGLAGTRALSFAAKYDHPGICIEYLNIC
jgi:hypothetical protein